MKALKSKKTIVSKHLNKQKVSKEALDAAHRSARKLLKKHTNILGISIGPRSRAGVFIEPTEMCVVLTVEHKLAVDILPKLKIPELPKTLKVRLGRKKIAVPVDIRSAHGQASMCLRQGGIGGPLFAKKNTGRGIIRSGTIGAIVYEKNDDENEQELVLTAGHVGGWIGKQFAISDYCNGVVSKIGMNTFIDSAIIRPDIKLPNKATEICDRPGVEIKTARKILSISRDELYFTALDRNTRIAQWKIIDTNATAPVIYPGMPKLQVSGLISALMISGKNSDFGDSGMMLYDENFCGVGTLLGTWGRYDFFVPLETVLKILKVNL